MKISIELTIGPDEVALASELLSTLRAITDHVKVSTPAAAPASAPISTVTAQPAAPAPAPVPVPAPAPVPLPVPTLKDHIRALVARLADESQLDGVSAEISGILNNPGTADEGTSELTEALDSVISNPDMVTKQLSVGPYFALLQRLPEGQRAKIRDTLTKKVLKHLAVKRPLDADRASFITHADAFAHLVKLDVVQVDGAVQTMLKLISDPDKRSAGITMLGKTMELCGDKLMTKTSPQHLNALWTALDRVTDAQFTYDLQYIRGTRDSYAPQAPPASAPPTSAPANLAPAGSAMPTASAPLPVPTPVSAAPPSQQQQPQQPVLRTLTATTSYSGHRDSVFSLTADGARRHAYSGGKDGTVLVYDAGSGQLAHKIDLPTHYVCSMDVHPRHNLLLVCGVSMDPSGQQAAPCVAVYDINARWAKRGVMSRHDRTLVSCLRSTGPEGSGFVTGETSVDGRELVAVYDLGQAASIEGMAPVQVYAEHTELVTTVCSCPGAPHMFVSGSRDTTVRVWDVRSPVGVGVFGSVDATTNPPTVHAHTDMVTCLDTSDGVTLVSASVDGSMCFWDLRTMSSNASGMRPPLARIAIDGQPLLKVALSGAPAPNLAAVSTFQGLYTVDWSAPGSMTTPSVTAARLFNDPNAPYQPYHDIKWAAGGLPLLYGASENPRVDVFTLAA